MKHIAVSLFAISASLITPSSSAVAIPLSWTVETSRAQPATFEAYQGETLALEASLQSYGKPLEAPSNYSFYWQTNGMGTAWWSTNCNHTIEQSEQSNNVLRATWTPSMETGSRVYNCFIGQPGTIYHAAFQLRLRPSPGALPNELPLPQKVIDFAKVTVLNPPWSGGGGGGGVDTNAVRDIIHETVSGSARSLPKYLHERYFDDSYPDEAEEYYRSRGNGKTDGGCSSVRDGGFLYRNFDYPFDDRAEFVVRMSSGTIPSASSPTGAGNRRFASVGIAQVGTNLTERFVTSGKPSRWYKALPGATVDGINENGVAVNVNVVDGEPLESGWPTNGTIHCLGAVRWVLDNATNAASAASVLATEVYFPSGWTQNFHYMVCDERETWIVENGSAHDVTDGVKVLTNFRLYPTRDTTGEGQERYDALASGENITSQWWTLTYTPTGYRASDLPGITGESLTQLFNYWENNPRESHRGETFPTGTGTENYTWWQTVHTSVYDLTNRTLRVSVQETDDWYTFAMPNVGGVKPEVVREIVDPMIGAATNGLASVSVTNNLRRVDDMAVYTVTRTENTDWTWTSENAELAAALNAAGAKPAPGDEFLPWTDISVGPWYTGGGATDPRNSREVTYDFENSETGEFHQLATAHRPRYMDETPGPAKTNQQLAAVATDEASKPADCDLVKYDAANDRLVKATAGDIPELPYLSTENGGEVEGVATFKSDVNVRGDLNIDDGGTVWADFDVKCDAGSQFSHSLRAKADRATTLSGYGITDAAPLSMISATDPILSNAVDQIVRSLMPTTLRAYDPVRQCWWNIQPVNGVLTLTVED